MATQQVAPCRVERSRASAASALHGEPHSDSLECPYVTPSGDERQLKITLIPVRVQENETLGLAVLVADHADAAALRQAQLLRAEESAEMALEVRNSLATIREWAEQLKAIGQGAASGLANDISSEAMRLETVLGEFVSGSDKARGAHV